MFFEQRLQEMRQEFDRAALAKDLWTLKALACEVAYLSELRVDGGCEGELCWLADEISAAIAERSRAVAVRLTRRVCSLLNWVEAQLSSTRPVSEMALSAARRKITRAESLIRKLDGARVAQEGWVVSLRQKLALAHDNLSASETELLWSHIVLGSAYVQQACGRRRVYSSAQQAREAQGKGAYRCAYCGQWHATSRLRRSARIRTPSP